MSKAENNRDRNIAKPIYQQTLKLPAPVVRNIMCKNFYLSSPNKGILLLSVDFNQILIPFLYLKTLQ